MSRRSTAHKVYLVLFKTPRTPNPKKIVLIVVVLTATRGEPLVPRVVPRVVRIGVLGRTPIVACNPLMF